VSGVIENAVAERVEGERPGRLRSVIAAAAIGVTCAALAYKLLRHDEGTIDYS
jgi:hypothetical protein